MSAPQVDDPICRSGEILGNLTQEEAEEIAEAFNRASRESVPDPADLGDDSIVKGPLPDPILYDKNVALEPVPKQLKVIERK